MGGNFRASGSFPPVADGALSCRFYFFGSRLASVKVAKLVLGKGD